MSQTTNVISVGNLNTQPGSGYVAVLTMSYPQPEANISRVARDTDAPIATNVALGVQVYYLQVYVEDAEADVVDARRRALLRELDATRGPLTVVIENAEGTPRRRFMQFVVRKPDQVEGQGGQGFLATLESFDQVRWQATTLEEVVWTLDESGARSLTVAGDLDVFPTYVLTPNSAKATPNWPYSRRVMVEWRSPHGGRHPIDVTGGGLDTEALLALGKISDGSNIAVFMNGVLRRHFYQPDGFSTSFGEAQTQIWIDMEFQPAVWPELAGFINASATTWPVYDDEGLPQAGTLKVDDELVSYTSRSPGYLYGVSRGRHGTTAAAHNAGERITHYQGVGWILYGPAAVVPESMIYQSYRNAVMPVVVTPGSSNAEWRYNEFAAASAPGSWSYYSHLNNLGFVNESDANGSYDVTWQYPWRAMGFKAGWTSTSVFRLRLAVPVKQTRVIGRQIARLSPSGSPNAPVLDAWSDDGQTHATLWAAGGGASREANNTFDQYSGDVRPFDYRGYNKLQWSVVRESYLQADIQTMWVTLDDNATPIVSVASELTDYDLDLTIANTTTGESLTAQFPNMAPGESLVIDSAWQTVTYTLDGSSQYAAVRRDAARPRFLRLVPGVNEFQITEAGMGELEIRVQYRPRWYT